MPLAVLGTACGSSSTPTTPTDSDAVSVTESFTDTLTVNGAKTQPFTASRAGTVTATITALSPDATVTVGLSLGTWNGSACQIIIANDAAVLNTVVTGTAQATGNFCVRVYDVGKLTAATDYTLAVTHF
jgi:hypothetical protein